MEISLINQLNDQFENDETLTSIERKKLIDDIYRYSSETNEPNTIARSLVNLANFQLSNGEVELALQNANNAFELSKKHHLDNVQRRVCNLLGNIQSYYGRYGVALDYYHQSLRIAQHLDMKGSIAAILNNIATLYEVFNMGEQAVKYYISAQKAAKSEHNYKLTIMITHNIINHYFAQKNVEMVRRQLEAMGELMTHKSDVSEYHALFLINSSRYLYLQEEYEAALKASDDAFTLFETVDDAIGIRECQMMNSRIYDALGEVEKAYEIGIKLADSSEEIGDFDAEREARLFIHQLTEKISYREDILENYKRLISLDELLLNNLYEMSLYQIEGKIDADLQNQLKRDSDRLMENMSFINEVAKDLAKELDYDTLVKLIITKMASFVEFDALVLGLYDEEKELLYSRMTYENGEIKESYDVPLSNKSSLGTWVIRHRKEYYTGYLSHLVLDDFEPLHKNFQNISVPYETIYYSPLIVDEKVIGVFSLQRYTINGYDHAQIEMMRALSSYIAIAIANALKTAQMKDLNERLKTISKRDGLSGLLNRYALNEDVGIILDAFNTENRSLSTLMCDIDFFKEYNDYYGHLEGDKVIKTIAQVLEDACGHSTSYIYRYGGDEFMIVFLDCDEDEVAAIAQKILKTVSDSNMPHVEKGINEKVSVSIGLAYFELNKEILNEDDLLRSADISLYISKRKGRNQARSMKF